MILPKNDQCRRVMLELKDEPTLTEFEYEFVTSNQTRTEFTDKQRDIIGRMMEKYDCE